VGNKIYKTTEILDKIYHLKNQGVTYWAERTGLLIDHIIDFNCFGTNQKDHLLFFEYLKIGCMYLDKFLFI
jgi:hypothetical protein